MDRTGGIRQGTACGFSRLRKKDETLGKRLTKADSPSSATDLGGSDGSASDGQENEKAVERSYTASNTKSSQIPVTKRARKPPFLTGGTETHQKNKQSSNIAFTSITHTAFFFSLRHGLPSGPLGIPPARLDHLGATTIAAVALMAQLPQKLPFEEGASEISDLYEEAIKVYCAQMHVLKNGAEEARRRGLSVRMKANPYRLARTRQPAPLQLLLLLLLHVQKGAACFPACAQQWRHALRKKQVELSRAAASAAAAANTIRPRTVREAQETSQTGLKTPPSASTGASAAAFEGGASSSLPGNSTPLNVEPGATARAASEPPSRASGAPRASETSEPKNEGEDEGDDTEDEFEDAEVDAAEEGPPVLGVPQGPLCALRNPTDEGGQPEPRVAATASTGGGVEGSVTAAAVAAAQPPHATENASQQTKESKSLDQEDSDEDREEGFGLSVDDVSDLDDAEPQTTDGIFGFFEKACFDRFFVLLFIIMSGKISSLQLAILLLLGFLLHTTALHADLRSPSRWSHGAEYAC
ncbi:hypothetical protein cyc_02606 [Cyclospora cayetanensis]|uniref:Uncharacterized protein n=1 Tax=Cyclospora cayetanensis TaxID=88456 RepID=A0A1D3D264_9EIME|nr:hypothetical protein cyc_02606 [Cyclospora cayetanensis]